MFLAPVRDIQTVSVNLASSSRPTEVLPTLRAARRLWLRPGYALDEPLASR